MGRDIRREGRGSASMGFEYSNGAGTFVVEERSDQAEYMVFLSRLVKPYQKRGYFR